MDPADLLGDLDPDQRAAVSAEHALVAVIAGAGSGKTRVLTRRIAYRLARGEADAQHTVALTFTREAAGELRRRLRLLGLRERIEAGTFHSVMLGVQRQRWADTDTPPKKVLADRRRYVQEIAGRDGRAIVDELAAEVDWAAARGIGPGRYSSAARQAGRRPSVGLDRVTDVLEQYEQLKRRRGVIDFDDVLRHTVDDMRRDRQFAESLRWRFRHLHLDEAQDLNPVQHELIDLLRQGRDDLFLVGDPAQAIFGFNGADPSLLVDVETRFPGVEVIRLPVNHRCTPQIVSLGVQILRSADTAADYVSNRGDGPAVDTLIGADEHDEADRVARWLTAVDPRLVRSGSVAVLARTNHQLRSLGEAIRSAGLPVRRIGTDPASPLQRALTDATGQTSASGLRGWAHDVLDAPPPPQGPSIDRGRGRRQIDRVAKEEHDADEANRRVAEAVLEFLRDQPHGDGAALRTWVATTNPFDEGRDGGVELLTFHAAKGREWHTVAVVGVETSLVPHRSATTAAARAEEARLLYVACTRATDRLLIARAERRGGYARNVSPFIDGVDLSPAPVVPPPGRRSTAADVDPLDRIVRDWRQTTARRAGIAADLVISDRDLAIVVERRPRSLEELISMTSLGPMTAERLAGVLLPLLADPDVS